MRRYLFLTLTTFSQTGGIEKFNRCFSKALNDFSESGNIDASVSSVYDKLPDNRYIRPKRFKGYSGRRWWYILSQLWKSRSYDEIIIGHINLAILMAGIKKFFPSKKIILIIHGIEAMEPLKGIKKKALQFSDEIWAVSEFTRQNIIEIQQLPSDKIKIFYNAVDPFFLLPASFEKPQYILDRYAISHATKILLTVTRLNHAESYKGYDKVLEALPEVKKIFPHIRYIIAGKGDEKEIQYVNKLIESNHLQENVILTGFIPEQELTDHFLVSDVFIMPSTKEGFGIVFIEAMACGLNVIGGNKDGSVDALANGRLGKLVNPDSIPAISSAIIKSLEEKQNSTINGASQKIQMDVMNTFGFEQFKHRLETYLVINN